MQALRCLALGYSVLLSLQLKLMPSYRVGQVNVNGSLSFLDQSQPQSPTKSQPAELIFTRWYSDAQVLACRELQVACEWHTAFHAIPQASMGSGTRARRVQIHPPNRW